VESLESLFHVLKEVKSIGGSHVRVGVVGLGKMGLLHSCILKTLPRVGIVAVCDRSLIIRRIATKIFKDAQVTNDVSKMVDLNLDAIYVTTPLPSHFSVVKTIYSNNIARHLFVEKTLASNFNEAKELFRSAKSVDGVNMVGYMKRYAVTFRKAKELLDKRVLGDLKSFSAYAYSSDFAEKSKGSKGPLSRGGVLKDLGSHVIDLALWYFGGLDVEFAVVEGSMTTASEDAVRFRVKTLKGILGDIDVSWCKKGYRMPEFGFSIYGSEGLINVNDDQVTLNLKYGKPRRWYRHDLVDNVGFLIGAPEYYREDEAFIKAVQGNCAAAPDFLEASKVDYVIEQVKTKANHK